MKEELRCAGQKLGGLCAMTSGVSPMQELFANN